jgi:hypothetical protein
MTLWEKKKERIVLRERREARKKEECREKKEERKKENGLMEERIALRIQKWECNGVWTI